MNLNAISNPEDLNEHVNNVKDIFVSPQFLKRAIDLAKDDRNCRIRILHVGDGNETLPLAHVVQVDWFEEPPLFNRKEVSVLEGIARSLGICPKTTVICSGNNTMGNCRVGAILKSIGINDVRILFSLKKYTDAGFLLTDKSEEKLSFVKKWKWNIDDIVDPIVPIFIDLKEVLSLGEDSILVSIRTEDEHLGITSGYDYIHHRGDIPGAINTPSGSDSYHLETYTSASDDSPRDSSEIFAMWRSFGIDTKKHIVFYCGTGWRASQVFFVAISMGLTRVSIFDGGWKEWSEKCFIGIASVKKEE